MNIKDCDVGFASDLKDYGYTEDGEKFIGEVFYVYVTTKRGDRWVHETSYPGVRVHHGPEGQIAFEDTRNNARAWCEYIVGRIRARGWIDFARWSRTDPVYGSDAYMEYGADADFQRERQEEGWSLRADFT